VADASLTIAIKTDPAQPLESLARQAKDAEKEVEGLGASFAKVGAALGGLAALKGTFDFVLNATRQMEDLTTQFIAFTGSAEGASKQVERLVQFANTSPFALAEVAEANKTLLAFGSSTQESLEQLRQLGEVSAATGKDLGELATIFGQIQAEGKLTGERFNQLIERGVNIGPELAKSLGVASTSIRGLISDSQISAEEVAKAFQKMTSEGGQFFGSTDRLSKTVSGSLSTLGDSVTSLAATIGKQGAPAFAEYANGLTAVISAIDDFVKERAKIAAETGDAKRIRELNEEIASLGEKFNNLKQPTGLTKFFEGIGAINTEGLINDFAAKIKTLVAERNRLLDQANKELADKQRAEDEAEKQRAADKEAGKASDLQKTKLAEEQAERDKAAAQELAQIQEKEKKITEIAFQESAIRNEILKEQEGTQDEEKIARLQEREAELTAERLKIEADRLQQLGQFDEAELLRDQDRVNKKLQIEKESNAKLLAEEKKANEGKTKEQLETQKKYQSFVESGFQKEVEASRVGLSALANLRVKGSRDAFNIAKRAAQAQILLDTPKAAFAAFASFAGFGPLAIPLGTAAAAAVIATSASRLAELEKTSIGFAEGGIVPGVGNRDTVPALLTPGEVVVPKSNFEDLQKSLQGGVTADQIVLLQQSNEIQAKILNEIVFGAVSDKLTQIVAGIGRVSDRIDALSTVVSTSSSRSGDTGDTGGPPAEPPQVTPQPTSQEVQRKNRRQDAERSR
jgi:tape measure domain-containing protein